MNMIWWLWICITRLIIAGMCTLYTIELIYFSTIFHADACECVCLMCFIVFEIEYYAISLTITSYTYPIWSFVFRFVQFQLNSMNHLFRGDCQISFPREVNNKNRVYAVAAVSDWKCDEKKTNIKPDLPSFFIIITLRMKNTSSISFQFMIHIKRLSLCGRVEIYSCEYHKVWSWMNHGEKNEWKIPSSSIAKRTLKYFWHWFDQMHRGKFGFYSNSWLKFTDHLHLHVTVNQFLCLRIKISNLYD